MEVEVYRCVDLIRTKLLDDPNFDAAKLKDMEVRIRFIIIKHFWN